MRSAVDSLALAAMDRVGTSDRGPSRWLFAASAIFLALYAAGCDDDKGVESNAEVQSVTVRLRFSGPRYAGSFYSGYLPATDCAVWVQTASGEHVQTLAVTPTVVSVGDYSHLDHLPAWQASSGVTYAELESQTDSGVAPDFDGVTKASVLFQETAGDTTLVTQWNLEEASAGADEGTEFRFCAEVANISKDAADSYTIISEHTCGTLDLDGPAVTPAPTTEHILELSAVVHEPTTE